MNEQQQLNDLISDIEYLQYEAQSLSNVIESVPYSEKPLGGESIIENLMSVHSAQSSILEIFNDLDEKGMDIDINNYSVFDRVELTEQEIGDQNVKDLIQEIEKTRSSLTKIISDKPQAFFSLEFEEENSPVTVLDLLLEMVQRERNSLKEIANLVLTYQKDRQFQREISGKK
ncbi:MAG: hypothetical protein JJ892_03430 [Balneola sp.]|nr:hypothetical protein [Balneola sp.]MBO6650709.1 hypothetical protein [Balneola sp.]MBO6710621.1 hypothetical protein [Balneola sp.]MBO6799307.1 hypothetical protein [Balneola sp.]MBO6869564.1 hypothetical protein [Balneola sp.]